MQSPTAARERIAIAPYPFRDFVAGHEDKPGSGKIELQRVYGMRQPRRSLRRNGGTRWEDAEKFIV